MGIWWVYHGYIMGSTQFVLDSKDSPFFRPWFASGWEYCEMNMAGSISWTGSAQASWQVGPKMRANQILSPQVKLCHLAGNPTKIVYYLLCKKTHPWPYHSLYGLSLALSHQVAVALITNSGWTPKRLQDHFLHLLVGSPQGLQHPAGTDGLRHDWRPAEDRGVIESCECFGNEPHPAKSQFS